MLVPVKWIKNYIDIKKTTREISDRVTDSGSHVESISKLDEGIDNLIVGEIKEIKSHPTRSKLSILDIDLGDEVISLITGATWRYNHRSCRFRWNYFSWYALLL